MTEAATTPVVRRATRRQKSLALGEARQRSVPNKADGIEQCLGHPAAFQYQPMKVKNGMASSVEFDQDAEHPSGQRLQQDEIEETPAWMPMIAEQQSLAPVRNATG